VTVAPMIVLLFVVVIAVVGVLAVLFAWLAYDGGKTRETAGTIDPTMLATVPRVRGADPSSLHLLVVGEDIEPGTYTSQGGRDEHLCTWARVRGFSGQRDDVVQSGTSAGPVTVTIQAADKGFVTGWCGEWTGPS
jgi:hypothetical protein